MMKCICVLSCLRGFPMKNPILKEPHRARNGHGVSCSFGNCGFCSFGEALNVPDVEFMGLLTRPPNCHIVKRFF